MGWIARGSASRHLDESDKHNTNIAINFQRREANASCREHLQSTYEYTSFALLNSHILDPSPSTRVGFFDNDTVPDPDPMFHNYDEDYLISAGISPQRHDPEDEQEQLCREVELMMMEAEQLDELGPGQLEDDPTVTNITQELDMLGKIVFFIVLPKVNLFSGQILMLMMMISTFRMVSQKP